VRIEMESKFYNSHIQRIISYNFQRLKRIYIQFMNLI